MKTIVGGVTAPRGYTAAGIHAGIKREKRDLALICSERPAACAGCFTQNVVKAAPVLWDMEHFKNPIRGIAVTSGNANACTGEQGLLDTREIAESFAREIGAPPEDVLVCATGVIGVPLPMDVILKGIRAARPALRGGAQAAEDAAAAICTTDTVPKQVAVELVLGGKTVTIGAMAKGSGMLHPNMATLLAFVTTDAAISRELLQAALSGSVKDSYNMISVDGDTSTNDTILALANGMAGNAELTRGSPDYARFQQALRFVNESLAKALVRDGEGATKLIEAVVQGAATPEDARALCKSVISSNLVKTAMFGEDANWGRVLCAMGYSGAKFDPEAVSLRFASRAGEVPLLREGKPIPFDENLASAVLKEREIQILIGLSEGGASAVAWGSDLSYDYIKINGSYRT